VVGRLGRPPGLGERGGQRLVVGQLVDGQLGEVGDQLVALPGRVPQVLGRLGQVLAGLHVVDRVDHGGPALAAVREQLVQLDRLLPCRVDARRGGRRGARGGGGGDRLVVAALVVAVAPAAEQRARADTEDGDADADSGQQRHPGSGTAAPAAGSGGTPTAATAARAGRGGSRSAGRGVLDAGHLLGGPGRSGVAAEEVVELGGRLPVGVTGRLPVGGGALVGHRGDVLGGLGVRVARGRERAVTGRAVRVVPRVGGGLVAAGQLGRQRARAGRGYGRYVLRRALVGAGRHRRQELGGPLRPVRRPARPAGDGRQVLGGPLGRHGRQGRAGAVGVAGPVGVVGGSAVGALRAVARAGGAVAVTGVVRGGRAVSGVRALALRVVGRRGALGGQRARAGRAAVPALTAPGGLPGAAAPLLCGGRGGGRRRGRRLPVLAGRRRLLPRPPRLAPRQSARRRRRGRLVARTARRRTGRRGRCAGHARQQGLTTVGGQHDAFARGARRGLLALSTLRHRDSYQWGTS